MGRTIGVLPVPLTEFPKDFNFPSGIIMTGDDFELLENDLLVPAINFAVALVVKVTFSKTFIEVLGVWDG